MSFGKKTAHSFRNYGRAEFYKALQTGLFLCVGTLVFIGVLIFSAVLTGYNIEVVLTPLQQLVFDVVHILTGVVPT